VAELFRRHGVGEVVLREGTWHRAEA